MSLSKRLAPMGVSLLAVVLVCCMVGAAKAILANWNSGEVYRDVVYDAGVRLQSDTPHDPVRVKAEISKSDIAVSDLSAWYWDGSTWVELSFNDAGDTLVTFFGPSTGFEITAGYDNTTPILLQYHTTGYYNLDMTVVLMD